MTVDITPVFPKSNMIMEAKKCHNLPSAGWRTRKAGGVIQSESEGLRIKGLMI